MPTRAQLIADLKGRGVGGKLSKMTKSQLLDLAEAKQLDKQSAMLAGSPVGCRFPLQAAAPARTYTTRPQCRSAGLLVAQSTGLGESPKIG
jgi:hypothetical protein